MKRFIFSWSEFLLTSYVVMLVAGAVGASLDVGTLSFLQTLGILYVIKAVVSTATVSMVATVESIVRLSVKK